MKWLVAGTAVVAVAMGVLVSGCAVAQPEPPPTYAPIPPPRAEVIPPPPGGRLVWEPGHWHWNGAQYVWIGGHYIERRPEYRHYAEGHWVWRPREGGWVWHPAHWE